MPKPLTEQESELLERLNRLGPVPRISQDKVAQRSLRRRGYAVLDGNDFLRITAEGRRVLTEGMGPDA